MEEHGARHTRMMKEDPENHQIEREWGWQNRGNVWDMMAICWTGEKDWMIDEKSVHRRVISTSSSLHLEQNEIFHGTGTEMWKQRHPVSTIHPHTVALLHIFVFFVSNLSSVQSCTFDHHADAFALVQVVLKKGIMSQSFPIKHGSGAHG